MLDNPCPSCGKSNRLSAKFCQYCGQAMSKSDVEDSAAAVSRRSKGLFSNLKDEFGFLAEDAKSMIQSFSGAKKGETKTPVNNAASRSVQTGVPSKPATPTRMIAQAPPPKQIGEQFGGYLILKVWPLARSNYYQVRQVRCLNGHENKEPLSSRRCVVCQSELPVFLARESLYDANQGYQDRHQAFIQLSQSPLPGFLRQVSIFPQNERFYVIAQYPGESWLSLAQVNLPVWDQASLIQWCLNLGEALQKLAQAGFVPWVDTPSQVMEPIVVIGSNRACFADLTIFRRNAILGVTDPTDLERATQQAMIHYLGQIIYVLMSARPQNLERAPRDFSDVPSPFRGILSHVVQGRFVTLDEFLQQLGKALVLPEARRSLRQMAGYRTDVGRQRGHNEDFVGKYSLGMQQTPDMPEVGLYLVADGMGGHQAGEVASQDVVRVILDEIQEKVQALQSTPKVSRSTIKLQHDVSVGGVLIHAILRANEVLYNAREQVGSDRGTTITAALIVGQVCAVANVGDSRTYWIRDEQLKQITQDHSLVASLLAANVIQPEEVRVHPERSRIFRSLGERPEVDVDIYEVQLRAKDRLLLCSDGLWEMVLDPEIRQIMLTASDPQETCDQLVEAANLAGGQDNISVVCVWMT